jgi:hypothetical protein
MTGEIHQHLVLGTATSKLSSSNSPQMDGANGVVKSIPLPGGGSATNVFGIQGSPGILPGPAGTAKIGGLMYNCRVGPDGMVYMDAHTVCKIFKGNPATGLVQVVAENTLGSCSSTNPISVINNTPATSQARDFTYIGMMPNGDILYNAGKVSCLHTRVGHSIARVQLGRCAIKTRQ